MITEAIIKTGPRGIISIEKSPVEESLLFHLEGGILPKGFSDLNYVAKSGKDKLHFENPLILVGDISVQNPKDFTQVLEYAAKLKRPIVLFVNSASENCHKQILFTMQKEVVQCVLIEFEGLNDAALDYLQDLSVLFDAPLIDYKLNELLGNAKEVPGLLGSCKKMDIEVLQLDFMTSEFKTTEHKQRIADHTQTLIGKIF